MATLVLTAVGTSLGGPVGGAIGAFIGREADQTLFGPTRRGPRLKELSVTTSSYGKPLPRNFGRMRVAGTIVWATELQETTNKGGGGKGKPSLTTYSYSVSFAVALSSTPLARVGRVWADGNLLRGADDDLKVAGQMRFYSGAGDAEVDPIIAADKGALAPAFRDISYVVFEDLQLGDFGNRIPALTFEVFAPNDAQVSVSQLVPFAKQDGGDVVLKNALGFADEGGPISSTLSALNQVYPMVCTTHASGLRLSSSFLPADTIPILPEQITLRDSEGAAQRHRQRGGITGNEPLALRYYDEERDYQPSIQRAFGRRPDGRELTIDLPATMNAQGARQLANSNAHRERWRNERVVWTTSELDTKVGPGSVVKLPDAPGIWLVKDWEWSNLGVELVLDRLSPEIIGEVAADAGVSSTAPDDPITSTQLIALEAPPETNANPSERTLLAAVTSKSAGWRGAALFVEQGASLADAGTTGSARAIAGTLTEPLRPSLATHIEGGANLRVTLFAPDLAFENTDVRGLVNGSNRLMVGDEVIQFLRAESLGNGNWQLSGLLRGRAGTEPAALAGHAAGSSVVLLNERTIALEASLVPSGETVRIAAIGLADQEPVFTTLQNTGLSRRALMPVAARVRILPDNSWQLCWTRRARGQWTWPEGVEVPLIEEQELYRIGYGTTGAPFAVWTVSEPQLIVTPSERASLLNNHGAADLWVKQVGTYGQSPALHLVTLS